jgi:hypothetical protein
VGASATGYTASIDGGSANIRFCRDPRATQRHGEEDG